MTKATIQASSSIAETGRPNWETPRIFRMDVDAAEGSFAGVGADSGVYS